MGLGLVPDFHNHKSEMNESSLAELSLSFDDFVNTTSNNESYDYYNGTPRENGTKAWMGMGNTEYIFDRTDVRAIFYTIYTIVFCSCFFGNLMVILVVTLHWRMRSITNFCLANLAFADLCVGVFCVYQNMIIYMMDNWILGDFMCKMYHFINTLSHTASILILVVICIERYLAIIHPMRCKQMLTLNRLRVTIVMVWIISAVYSSPRFYYIKAMSNPLMSADGKVESVEVICIPDRQKYDSRMMDIISMLLLFFVPLFVISLLYTKIAIVLWRSSQNKMPSASPSESSSSSCGRDYEMSTNTNFNGRHLNRSASFSQRASNGTGNRLLCWGCPCGERSRSSRRRESRRRSQRGQHIVTNRGNCCSRNGELGNHEFEAGAVEMTATVANSSNTNFGAIVQTQQREERGEGKLPKMNSGGSCNSNNTEASTLASSLCCSRFGSSCYASKRPSTPTNKGNVSFSHPPVSPYLKRSPPIPISTAEPIVVVKFEKKSSLRKSKGKRSRCTILMNTQTNSSSPVNNGALNEQYADLAGDGKLCAERSERLDSCCAHACLVKEIEGVDMGKGPLIPDRDLNLCMDVPEKNLPDSGVSTLNTPTMSLHGDPTRNHILHFQHPCTCACCPHHNGSAGNNTPNAIHLQSNFESAAAGPHVSKGVRRMRVVRGSKYGTRALQSRRKIIRMLVVIVFAFAVCNFPFHARKMWQYFGTSYSGGSVFSSLFTPLTFLIMYCNSGINPILYAFMSKKFRLSFRDLLCCKLRRSLRISRNASVRSTHINPMSTAA